MNNINIVVCPKQKLVKIYEKGNKKKKPILLKTYKFKQNIPLIQKTIKIEHYNYGEWCVSERGWTEDKIINVYDEDIINLIKQKTLIYYYENI